MSPNAWDRAQRAISRAEKRDATVVTPDNAVSPFDASATTVIPQSALPGRAGRHQRPDDATTEVQTGAGRRPSPRPVAPDPPTTPVDYTDDAPTEDVATSPDVPPAVRTRSRPDTSPFAAADVDGASRPVGSGDPEVVPDADPPRRGLWARLFGRG